MTTTNKITETKSNFSKSNNQWRGETIRTELNKTFEISTFKSGKYLYTVAKEVEIYQENGFIVTKHVGTLFQKPFFETKYPVKRVTEKTIKEAHYKALAEFDTLVNSQEVKQKAKQQYKAQIFDILFLDGYGKSKRSEENKHIIYKIEQDERGNKIYHTIEADSLELNSYSRINDFKNKFGIGMYFEENYNIKSLNISENDMPNMLIDAQEKQKIKNAIQKAQDDYKKEEEAKKAKYLSQFTKADRRKTTNLIKKYLKETYPIIQKIEIISDVFSGGSSFDLTYYAPKEIKEVTNFVNSLMYGHFNSMEDIYEYDNKDEVIIYNHILMNYKYTSCYFKEVEPIEIIQKPLFDDVSTNNDVFVQAYSEKAGVIFGNTKPLKEELKKLGCRFNPRLTIDNKKQAGWIFPIKKLDQIKDMFC